MNRRTLAMAVVVACLAALGATPAAAASAPAKCDGKTVTVRGTDLNNSLRGTSGDDVIHGGAGKDEIVGLGGNDVICGGSGGDTIGGGQGLDRIFGQSGGDRVRDPDNARVWGSTGTDAISLINPTGKSYVNAGYDPDNVYIDDADGDFTVKGGMGNDRFYYGAEAGQDQVEDTDENVTINLTMDTVRTADARIELLSFHQAQGGAGDDVLYGSSEADWLDGGPLGDDEIFGRGGNDELWGDQGIDILHGGDGEDTCYDWTPEDPEHDIDCEHVFVDPDVENEG